MGTGLYPIANHQIPFEGKSLAEIIAFIQPKLDALELNNWEYLLDFAASWYGAGNISTIAQWLPVREDPQYYDYDTASYKEITFNGPYELSIAFEEDYILFWSPPYRYSQWFGLQNADGSEAIEARNVWRSYMKAVIRLFGGNRVIYLADNSHPLDKYLNSGESVEEMTQSLKTAFGEPAKSFREVLENDQTTYLIDYFEDL